MSYIANYSCLTSSSAFTINLQRRQDCKEPKGDAFLILASYSYAFSPENNSSLGFGVTFFFLMCWSREAS